MSFRLKIILGAAAIQAVLLVILIWGGLSILQKSSEKALLTRTRTAVGLFASTTEAAVLSTDLASLDSAVSAAVSNPDIMYARVLSNQGILAQAGDKQALARKFVADTSLASATKHGEFDTYADITVAGEKYGRVEMGFSTKAIQRLIADTRIKSYGMGFFDLPPASE